MGKHHEISAHERDKIAWWLACGMPIREIGRQLNRSHSSILAEIKRNKVDGIYAGISSSSAKIYGKNPASTPPTVNFHAKTATRPEFLRKIIAYK